MYRIITITGVLLTLLAILAGVLTQFSGDGLWFGQIPAKSMHIYIAYAVAGIAGITGLMAWWQTGQRKSAMTGSLLLLVVVGVQVLAGVHILKHPGQQPWLLTLHLLTATVILCLFFRLWLRSNPKIIELPRTSGPVNVNRFAILVLFLQIVLGSLVSVNHAGTACSGFPQCNGQWWPQADYSVLLTLLNPDGALALDGQVALNWLHRFGGLVCFILLNALMLLATSSRHQKSVRHSGLWLSILLFIEIGLGVAAYRFNMPLEVLVAHSVFAALLTLPLIAIGFYSLYDFTEIEPVKGLKVNKKSAPLGEDTATVTDLEPESTFELNKAPTESDVLVVDSYVEPTPDSLFLRLKSQLTKTRFGLGGLFPGNKSVTDELLEDIEANLLVADVGIDVTSKIINRLTQRLDKHQLKDSAALSTALKEELFNILTPCSQPLRIPKQETPFVILVVGVNGAGKTTTIGKLAKRLQAQGYSVMLAAGDTFRAAAVEQLQTWGERNNIQVIAQQTGADSASVIFDGIQSAQAKGVDVLIADTAGRLHTKSNLMEELKKVKRIMTKLDATAPHEVLLVVDAATGQNALSQAKQFNAAVELTGIALTKLDGTAKGGVIFALAKQTGIPIRFIGVGESIDDLQDFDAQTFIDALFVND